MANLTDDDKKNPNYLFLLLAQYVELNSEHSRWSTAITLIISITVASFIALLGAFIQVQNFNLIHTPNAKFNTLVIPLDSMRLITHRQSNSRDSLKLNCVIKKDIQEVNLIINNDSLVGLNMDYSSENQFFNGGVAQDERKENECLLREVEKIQLDYLISKDETKLNILQILFTCTTLLGFIFTLYFYILRRNVDEEIKDIFEEIRSCKPYELDVNEKFSK